MSHLFSIESLFLSLLILLSSHRSTWSGGAITRTFAEACGVDDGYSMYVWTSGFNSSAPFCNGIYPESKTGSYASCWYHNWESSSARQHLWASTNIPGRQVSRIFLADVKKRIEYNGYSSATSNTCDATLVSFLTQAHKRNIKVYALFAVSDAAFSETYMARYPHLFNQNCGTDFAYFNGVSVNNEHFSKIRDCTASKETDQLKFLTDLQTTAANSYPLPLHFSVSWNWDCCDCSSSSYVTRELTWNGQSKSALQHMIDIADSVDVQVAYNLPDVMRSRSIPSYQYWLNKSNKSSTSALYVLAYTNPTELCQLSFSPHRAGSSTVTDVCNQADRTEAGLFAAFDYVEESLPGIIGGIHYMSGVFSTGMTTGWPKHDAMEYTCQLNQRFNYKKKKCVKKCRKGKVWRWDRCRCYCPAKCKKRVGRQCKPRCDFSRYKFDFDSKTCILLDSQQAGYIFKASKQSCMIV